MAVPPGRHKKAVKTGPGSRKRANRDVFASRGILGYQVRNGARLPKLSGGKAQYGASPTAPARNLGRAVTSGVKTRLRSGLESRPIKGRQLLEFIVMVIRVRTAPNTSPAKAVVKESRPAATSLVASKDRLGGKERLLSVIAGSEHGVIRSILIDDVIMTMLDLDLIVTREGWWDVKSGTLIPRSSVGVLVSVLSNTSPGGLDPRALRMLQPRTAMFIVGEAARYHICGSVFIDTLLAKYENMVEVSRWANRPVKILGYTTKISRRKLVLIEVYPASKVGVVLLNV